MRTTRWVPPPAPLPGRRHRIRTKLRRLSTNFCWDLFDLLLSSCSSEVSASLVGEMRLIARKRDAAAYYQLDTMLGLQCIANMAQPLPGNPAVVHMLASSFRKSTDIVLYSAPERVTRCLAQARLVDAAIPSARRDWETDDVYRYGRLWLAALLGSAPDMDEIAMMAKHGPGSTASTPYSQRSKYFKYCALPYRCTPAAKSHMVHCISSDARWASGVEDVLRRRDSVPAWAIIDRSFWPDALVDAHHPYNRITTVPKDGRKDRPIAKEQLGNMYLQLGVGRAIRTRLRVRGIDLNRQQENNRKYALESSLTREHFTIDLSNASDTVGYEFVRSMIPPDWFAVLDRLRAPWGVLPSGEAFLYRKFSSMGNGYTFELETLLFLAICKGVSRVYGHRSDRFQVFGDDIIGPDYLYSHVVAYLSYSGFLVNSEKSFTGEVPVRESCGVDAYAGRNIRPVFCKGRPQTVMEAIGLRNRYRAWFLTHLGNFPSHLDKFFLSLFEGDCPPIGPDSKTETDGWIQDGCWREGQKYRALSTVTKAIPAREFMLRKLMHELRCCTGDGGNFVVADSSDRIIMTDRVVYDQFDWLD